MDSVKPCPFCGSTNVNVKGVFNGRYSVYKVMCECGTTGRGSSNSGGPHVAYADAVNYWNRRTPAPAKKADEEQEPVAVVTEVRERYNYGELVIRKVEISTYSKGQLSLNVGDKLYAAPMTL